MCFFKEILWIPTDKHLLLFICHFHWLIKDKLFPLESKSWHLYFCKSFLAAERLNTNFIQNKLWHKCIYLFDVGILVNCILRKHSTSLCIYWKSREQEVKTGIGLFYTLCPRLFYVTSPSSIFFYSYTGCVHNVLH